MATMISNLGVLSAQDHLRAYAGKLTILSLVFSLCSEAFLTCLEPLIMAAVKASSRKISYFTISKALLDLGRISEELTKFADFLLHGQLNPNTGCSHGLRR